MMWQTKFALAWCVGNYEHDLIWNEQKAAYFQFVAGKHSYPESITSIYKQRQKLHYSLLHCWPGHYRTS